MKTQSDNPFIVYVGKYREVEILSGPEKAAKRIFDLHSRHNKTAFIQYFFDGKKYSLLNKLFSKESVRVNEHTLIYTVGLFRLIPLLINLKPGIIHIITFERFAAILGFIKIFSGASVIYNEHGIIAYENNVIKHSSFFYKLKDKICERIFLKYNDKVIFPSGSAVDIAAKYYRVDKQKTEILPNGIDAVFNIIKEPAHGNLIKAVIMNTSVYNKSGIDFLNKFIESVDFPIEIYSIGKNSEINANNANITLYYIEKLDSAGLAEFYKDKNIFLSLNNYDTFSISSVEAMAAGLIPVVTENTGMSSYIINGANGYKLKYGDTDILKINLHELSGNSELRNNIAAKCREIYSLLNWETVYNNYLNLYSKVLK